ncbi:MAG: DUF1838 family protein [Gammaproteobacteria bacterium]|jgi:hypothetical protein|nr:DUF1838 family protein [Gammaproteobacteria bacterium]MDP6617461.1 DUF1838 family protein [Gammaproteobacteria bacterium]MDP6695668.1 DUF1838 family protein [Gammaproteobacteria bacterium]
MDSNWMMKPRSRRDALLGIGGVTAGSMLLGACEPSAEKPSGGVERVSADFSDPKQSLDAFIKLTGDLDPKKETPGWFGGMVFGDTRRDRPLRPLFGVQGFGVVRTEEQPDGSFKVFNRELAFYTDPKTGKFIDRWKNAYTGEMCDVKPIHNMTVNAHLIVSEKVGTAIEMDFDGTLMEVPLPLGWDTFGDKVFSNFEVHTAFPNELKPEVWPRESAGKVLRIAEIFQRVASLSDVENSKTTSADYSGTWTRVGPWLPWMRQGQADGSLIFRTFMTKLESVDQIPPDLKAITEERLPDYFQAPPPETWGGKNDSSFSVYVRENDPLPPLDKE